MGPRPPYNTPVKVTRGLVCIKQYAPMIYTALCIMFLMLAYPLLGEEGGGWTLEFDSFLGPVK
jgi:hypothetical protein